MEPRFRQKEVCHTPLSEILNAVGSSSVECLCSSVLGWRDVLYTSLVFTTHRHWNMPSMTVVFSRQFKFPTFLHFQDTHKSEDPRLSKSHLGRNKNGSFNMYLSSHPLQCQTHCETEEQVPWSTEIRPSLVPGAGL